MEKRPLKSKLPAVAFACAALFAALPSSAIAQDAVRSQRVPYGDLDLTTEGGIKILDRRLDRAVERVCEQPGPNSIGKQRMEEKCQQLAHLKVQRKRDVAIARGAGERGQDLASNGSDRDGLIADAR